MKVSHLDFTRVDPRVRELLRRRVGRKGFREGDDGRRESGVEWEDFCMNNSVINIFF